VERRPGDRVKGPGEKGRPVTDELIFTSYPVFRAARDRLEQIDREVAVKEVADLLDEHSERVKVRGCYSTVGVRADADLVLWWVASSLDDLQDLHASFRRTQLGRALDQRETFVGLVRPAEFARDHLPAFAQAEPPKRYLCVYPFVRTPEWYLLPPEERAGFLRAHGEAGRRYPDVLANTTSAFGLGDYEWILAFEADNVDRIVELIRHLRGTEARRYTKLEIPFFTGVRKDLASAIADL
jgi:hydrogen peroxide-dependent heme synthase